MDLPSPPYIGWAPGLVARAVDAFFASNATWLLWMIGRPVGRPFQGRLRYFANVRCFSSSNQFSTTSIRGVAGVPDRVWPATTTPTILPSGMMS